MEAQMESPMISPENKIEMLRNCAFLAGAPGTMLSNLAARAGILRVPGGEAVVTKGEAGSTMYIIASGRVHVHDGNVSRAYLGEGEVFGEMSVLDSEVRSATVTTHDDTMLLSLERDHLFEALAENPACFQAILQAVLQREREIVQLVQTRSEQLLSYEKELEIGRRIQADFLPDTMPEIENWEIATWFEAAREVAGDFLDAFRLLPVWLFRYPGRGFE
jgi:CRP-like cAMP-binding protein